MDAKFAELVWEMRQAQKRYFRTLDPYVLKECRQLESEVDKALGKRGKTPCQQEKLLA